MDDWLYEKLRYYREMGFFREWTDLGRKETISQFEALAPGRYSGRLVENDPLVDFKLLSFDRSRVWLIEDTYTLGAHEEFKGRFYQRVLERLSSIANGLFIPQEIVAHPCGYCDGRDERIIMRFILGGEPKQVCFCADLDVLVLSFTEALNEMLWSYKHSFEQFSDDQSGACFVFFLSHEDKDRLAREKGWLFRKNPQYWYDLAVWREEQEDLDGAEENYRKGVAVGPHQMHIVSGLAICLGKTGRWQEAIGLYNAEIAFLSAKEHQSELDKWWLNWFGDRVNEIWKNVKGDR